MEAERAIEAAARLASRQDDHAQADVEVGMRLEIKTVIEDEDESGKLLLYKSSSG